MVDDTPVIIHAVERCGTDGGNDERDITDFKQFRRRKEVHVALKALDRIHDASLFDDDGAKPLLPGLDGARKSGRACPDNDDVALTSADTLHLIRSIFFVAENDPA